MRSQRVGHDWATFTFLSTGPRGKSKSVYILNMAVYCTSVLPQESLKYTHTHTHTHTHTTQIPGLPNAYKLKVKGRAALGQGGIEVWSTGSYPGPHPTTQGHPLLTPLGAAVLAGSPLSTFQRATDASGRGDGPRTKSRSLSWGQLGSEGRTAPSVWPELFPTDTGSGLSVHQGSPGGPSSTIRKELSLGLGSEGCREASRPPCSQP